MQLIKSWEIDSREEEILQRISSGETVREEIPFRIYGIRANVSAATLMCPFVSLEVAEIRVMPGSKNYIAVACNGDEYELVNPSDDA